MRFPESPPDGDEDVAAYALFDADDRLRDSNQAFRRLIGPALAEVGSAPTFESICRALLAAGLVVVEPGRSEAWLRERLAQHRRPGVPIEIERRDGRFQITESSLEDGGTVVHVVDVSERRVRETQALLAAERYRTFVAESSLALWCLEFEPPIPVDLDAGVQSRLICRDGVFAECNDAYARTYGHRTVDDIVGRGYLEVVPPSNEGHWVFWQRFVEHGYRWVDVESGKVTLDGEHRTFINNGHGVVEDGHLVRAWGTQQDVTAHVTLEDRLRASERRLRQLYDETPSTFLTVSLDGEIRASNRFGLGQLGHTAASLRGLAYEDLHVPADRALARAHLLALRASPREVHRCELRMLTGDGRTLWMRESARVVRGDHDDEILMVCEDVSEAHQLSEKLSYQASHDALTGLFNRYEFDRRLRRASLTAREEGSVHALCYLDLDRFKVVNDTLGHPTGDELLRQLAAVMRRCLRGSDTLARLGGDEFGVLMENCAPEDAQRVARNLVEAIDANRFEAGGQRFDVSASAGLVVVDGSSAEATALLSAADTACYAAKDQGGARVHTYSADDVMVGRRRDEMEWTARLVSALEDDRLVLFAQPIVDLAGDDGRLRFEVLLRLDDPDEGLLAPGEFLVAAERHGLAGRIDRWVVAHALDALRRSPDLLERVAMCCINLSGRSLGDATVRNEVLARLSAFPAPERICFELTETAAVGNIDAARAFMALVHDTGARFALDDFGSGFSSLAYLKNLPVDIVKIDGMFVRELGNDPVDRIMVRTIAEAAHATGKQVVAEFIESAEVLAIVRELGIEFGQGYHLGRPDAIERWLSRPPAGSGRR